MPLKNKLSIPLLNFSLIILLCLSLSTFLLSETLNSKNDKYNTATFAGGCFWCLQPPFDALEGVISTTVGYTGGITPNPNYSKVSSGDTDHLEAMQVRFDPLKVSYQQLLELFWHNIDPLAEDRQFCDIGRQYSTAIFYHNEFQKELASASKANLEEVRLKTPIATRILKAGKFYPAEEYHQDFYKKNPTVYKRYRVSCGRDKRLNELWNNNQVKE